MKLAKLHKDGTIWINPKVRAADAPRLRRHMKTYRQLRKGHVPVKEALKRANIVERGSMNLKDWRLYNLRLARVAKQRR